MRYLSLLNHKLVLDYKLSLFPHSLSLSEPPQERLLVLLNKYQIEPHDLLVRAIAQPPHLIQFLLVYVPDDFALPHLEWAALCHLCKEPLG